MKLKMLAVIATLPFLFSIPILASVSAAPAPEIRVQAALHGTQLTVRGSNFSPGSMVRIGVIDARNWNIAASVHVKAEPRLYACPPGASVYCGQPDPAAGNLYARITLRTRSASHLRVLYGAGKTVGLTTIDRH